MSEDKERAVLIPEHGNGVLRPFPPGVSGNPAGKPKGTKHISTWIQELMNDEEFTVDNFLHGGKQYKGAPIKAIIQVAMYQALAGEKDWADWLAKYGWRETVQHEHTVEIKPILGGLSTGELSANNSDQEAIPSPQEN